MLITLSYYYIIKDQLEEIGKKDQFQKELGQATIVVVAIMDIAVLFTIWVLIWG